MSLKNKQRSGEVYLAVELKYPMQGESREGKDLYDEPFGLNQSTSNVNFGIPARFQETKDLSDDYYDVERATKFVPELGLPREVRKYKDSYDEPFGLFQSASNINVELSGEDYKDTYLTQSSDDLELATNNVNMESPRKKEQFEALNSQPTAVEDSTNNVRMEMPAEQKEFEAFNAQPIAMKQSTSNVRMEMPAEEKEFEAFNPQPTAVEDSTSNVRVEMPAEEKEFEAFNPQPIAVKHSASNVRMEMPAEEKQYEAFNPQPMAMKQSTSNERMEMPAEEKQFEAFNPQPIAMKHSTSNVRMEMPAEEKEFEAFNPQPIAMKHSTSNVRMEMPAEEKQYEAFNPQPIAMKHSTSNVRMEMPAEEKEFEAFNPQPIAMKHSTSNVRMEMPAEEKQYEAFNPQPIAMKHSTSNVRMEMPAEEKEFEAFNPQPIAMKYSASNMEIPAEEKQYVAFNSQPIDMKHSTSNVRIEMPAEEKYYEGFNAQPFAMRHYPINVRAEQTPEVKRERFYNAEGFYDYDRSAQNVHVPMEMPADRKVYEVSNPQPIAMRHYPSNIRVEQTTERERFDNAEDFYDFGRSAKKVHVPMVPPAEEKWSNPVKPKGFNKSPNDYEYYASNLNIQKWRNLSQAIPLEREDFHDVPSGENMLADNLKVQYLVMSFNESNETISPRGSMQDPEQSNSLNEIQDQNITCPAEFAVLPDPNGDCNIYYMCHNWTVEKRTCPRDLHFNPISRVCDYPGRAVCDLKCLEENDRYYVPGYCNMYLDCVNGEGKYIRCSEGLHYNAITKQCDSPAKAACEITCGRYNTLVALPGRCNMYVHCQEGNATYHLCPPGLHFNPVTLKCDIPETEQCKIECLSANGYFPVLGQCNNYIECRNNHGRVISCPSGLHFNFLLQTCDIPSKAGCEMKCKEPNGYFPFPGVCSYFILCMNGTPFLKKCPGDLEFNEDTNQCDIVSKNHCLPYCPMENGIFPVDNHCDLYMRCTHGQPLVKRCPRGLHFNALFKHCDLPQNAKCEIPCPVSTGIFPLPGKCNKFMRCDNGTSSFLTCAQGLHFNARTLTCDWPPAAQCELSCPEWDGYYAVQGACNAYVVCSEGRPTLRKCPHGKHFNLEAKHCDYPEYANCEFVCPESDGLYPYRGHCDSYIHCEDGKPHVDSCPPGLLFNIQTFVCDLAENVHCYS